VTKTSSLDESTGKLSVHFDDKSGLVRGSFFLDVAITDGSGGSTRLRTFETVQI